MTFSKTGFVSGKSILPVQKEYRENDVCMGELLDALPADGLSIEEAFELAITAKKWADGDRFYRSINDGEPEEL